MLKKNVNKSKQNSKKNVQESRGKINIQNQREKKTETKIKSADISPVYQ